MKVSLFISLSFFKFLIANAQEFDCKAFSTGWSGNSGCPCKCVSISDEDVLNRIIIDKNNCKNLVIKNKFFKEVKKDVIIDASSDTSELQRLEVIGSHIESIANLADVSIGNKQIRYDSILVSSVEMLALRDVQPILAKHVSSLQQVQLRLLNEPSDDTPPLPLFTKISLLEFNRCNSKISLENDTFIFPGTSADLSSVSYQPEFIINNSPVLKDVQFKLWFSNTTKHLG